MKATTTTSQSNSDVVYRLLGLTKVYGQHTVLDIDALDIGRGETFALVGPSGAGKSTLLRLLNFLEMPTRGRLDFSGLTYQAGTEVPLEYRRRVTTVFQHPMLLNRSVWDNVAYGLRLRGQNDAHAQVQAALEEVGLANVARQGARTLSGGEAQRVALARAIVLQPEVLLLDEPTTNLDPYNVGLIEAIARRINQQHGTTLVLVTHNVFQAKRLATRVALMLEGKVVEVANAECFFTAPTDPRTAAFVRGDMVY
ncbi:MAG: phosphate ABC transporter ATP-binding protein [Chloroflexota bacterium]|nr:MAG: phosphate ABC transporter ATP-binding protein [Chloroflexota bacterium]